MCEGIEGRHTDDFMDWEERDAASISLAKHCIAGKFIKNSKAQQFAFRSFPKSFLPL